jgi:exosortase
MEHSSLSTGVPHVAVEPLWTRRRVLAGLAGRHAAFVALIVVSTAWAWGAFSTVIGRSLNRAEYEHYSHIVLLPCLVGYLLWLNRQTIRQRARRGLTAGVPVLVVGGILVRLGDGGVVTEPEHRLAIAMIGLIVMWVGGFVACYGASALRAVTFPFAFLLFMIPLPPVLLHKTIVFLQHGSAEAAAVIFGLIGMPVFRQDLVFALPTITIEVAEECSGIRSSLALIISGLFLSYLFLRTPAARVALGLLIVPIAIVKNALRIVVLSWLAVHVDPSFITDSLVHRLSGIPTFLVALAIFGTLAWVLRKSEQAILLPR